MVHAYRHCSWALQNRLIGGELGDRAGKKQQHLAMEWFEDEITVFIRQEQ